MLQLPVDVRVFLSSTFRDLRTVRQDIATRLREVFGAQLITMETFGSDEASPELASVRRVAECDVFVGIYARRYGSIDPASGKSITELELEEAERCFSSGRILALLLYVLDEAAPSDRDDSDVDRVAREGVQRLRERAWRHTPTVFPKPTDLPFLIIRDVLARLLGRFQREALRLRPLPGLPTAARLARPIGMEFLRSTDRRYLVGRDAKIQEIVEGIGRQPITLLLGSSGVGKTSLIHAGVFPRIVEEGWVPVYTRPLGLPQSDVCSKLEATIFEGRPSYRGPLPPLLAQVVAALEGARLLLVVDQFEDILSSREPLETERLIGDLQELYRLPSAGFGVLISYRADMEGRLGHHWQQTTGDPAGLPRVYLPGIPPDEAWEGAKTASVDLGLVISLEAEDEARIKGDFVVEGKAVGETGIYPPHLQIFVEHTWRTKEETGSAYDIQRYLKSGTIHGIVGSYLTGLLAYAQDREGHAQRILVALVRSYGVRAQRTIDEIAAETGLASSRCEEVLEQLVDLRLIRHIDGCYEVTHDYVAREVVDRLIDPGERELKRCRELLATKAAAFATTASRLSPAEVALLYRFRQDIRPDQAELRLILVSWLREDVPGVIWLNCARPEDLVQWIQEEDERQELGDEERASAALLCRRVAGVSLGDREWAAFRRYQLGVELAALIGEEPIACPEKILLWALRNRQRHVREAALTAVEVRICRGEWHWLSRLRGSSSEPLRVAYERLVLQETVPMPPEGLRDRGISGFRQLRALASARSTASARAGLRALRASRPDARSLIFGQALSVRAGQGIAALMRRTDRARTDVVTVLAGAAGYGLNVTDLRHIAAAYVRANRQEWRRLLVRRAAQTEWARERAYQLSRNCERRAVALGEAFLRAASRSSAHLIRATFLRIELTPSAYTIALSLIQNGSRDDIVLVLRRIAEARYEVLYWPQWMLARALARRMAEVGGVIPEPLRAVLDRRAFWEHPRAAGIRMGPDDLLPLANSDNRPLFIRLVAHALVGAATLEDAELLCRLATHGYRMVARAAGLRLVVLAGSDGIGRLQKALVTVDEHEDLNSLLTATRDAELQLYGLAQLW
ncbi:MAG: DUF4062 domain-containing protein [Candidatus Rokubacteria bacterium]|nr:DUF4062 domain-containing protein [Candidatus Rokubacteria bacterium]